MSPIARFAARAIQSFFSTDPSVYRGFRSRLRLALEATGFVAFLAFLGGRGAGPFASGFDALAWGCTLLAVGVLVAAYAHEVGVARRFLREAVYGEGTAADAGLVLATFDPYTLRGRSLFQLGVAFRDAASSRPTRAEEALQVVDRSDLGPWESRIYEATRTLSALARGEATRAARLAPLALATGRADVDRTVALALLRGAWLDTGRLESVERALRLGGPEAVRLATLATFRVAELSGTRGRWRIGDNEASTLLDASEDARLVGDPDLAEKLLAEAESGGVYR